MSIDSIVMAAPARIDKQIVPGDHLAARLPARAADAPANTGGIDSLPGNTQDPTVEQLSKAISELNQSVQAKTQGLEFSIDDDSKRTVVKVIDQSTKEVLRQIPTREALAIAKSLDTAQGFLIRQTA